MRSYALMLTLLVAGLLGCFGLFQLLDSGMLSDPTPRLSEMGRLLAAAASLGLLVGDVFLPIPASLVMVGNGVLFGAILGSLLSWIGAMGAAAVAFAFGRWGSGWVRRWVPASERRRADAVLDRWGDVAVVASRPVPILAESLAIVAGTTSLSWTRFLSAAALGNLPAALLYALTGATAAKLTSAYTILGLVSAIAAAVGLAHPLQHRRRVARSPSTVSREPRPSGSGSNPPNSP